VGSRSGADADGERGWKLVELAAQAGVSIRTVRYYVQRGLLSAPAFRGPDTVYGEEHLLRLQAIRRLQALHWPLDAIQVELSRRDAADLEQLASHGPASQVSPATAASWRRITLAEGLELHLSETAAPAVVELARRLRSAARPGST
jgi:DNA-binding transcriptional MerR regulator